MGRKGDLNLGDEKFGFDMDNEMKLERDQNKLGKHTGMSSKPLPNVFGSKRKSKNEDLLLEGPDLGQPALNEDGFFD